MARPKIKKNKYVVRLTPVSNFQVTYYGDDEEVEATFVGADWSNIMRQIIKHNEEVSGAKDFILPF